MIAVVLGVGNHVDGGVGDGLIHPGAGADGLGGHVLLGGRSGDDADDRQTLLQQGEVGNGGLDGNGGVVLLLDGGDGGQHRDVDVALGGSADEGLDDVVSGHGVAIGELGAVAQGDLIGGVVDLLGVAGGQLVVDAVVMEVQAVQTLDDVPVGAACKSGGGARRIEVGGGVGGACGDGAAALGAALGRSGAGGLVAAATAAGETQAGNCGSAASETEEGTPVHQIVH